MMTSEGLVISLRNFDTIGPIEDDSVLVGGGVTLSQLWQAVAPLGYWPNVVSGTSKITVAGAIAMNIHGKNAFKLGNIGEHVSEISLVSPAQQGRDLDAIGSMGLFGAIVSARLDLQRIESASVSVTARAPRTWGEHLQLFDEFASQSDYMVSWVDLHHRAGRGLFHAAEYSNSGSPLTARQSRESPLFGVVPRDQAWLMLKALNNPALTKGLNAAKYLSGKILAGNKAHAQTLAEFNFLLDALPGWERAYANGLVQFQAFVPSERAESVFVELQDLQFRHRIVSSLGVLKKHRASPQVLPYAVYGYSLALDFGKTRGLELLCQEMAEAVIAGGGRFYLAKDSTLTADQYQRSLPDGAFAEFRQLKQKYDPENILQSIQSRHLGLT